METLTERTQTLAQYPPSEEVPIVRVFVLINIRGTEQHSRCFNLLYSCDI